MSAPHPKVPRTAPRDLVIEPGDIREVSGPFWRIHRASGEHVLDWDGFRTWGPLPSMRFDPHPPPVGDHDEGVLYVAMDNPSAGDLAASHALATALAEVFQGTRLIDTISGAPHATSWFPTRMLRLLDITEGWALRNGASASLTAAPRNVCREWSRAIREQHPDLDGLLSRSTMTGGHNIVLFDPARDSLPTAPEFSRPLRHPTVADLITAIGEKVLDYRVLR